jgi:CBS domain-containing protein
MRVSDIYNREVVFAYKSMTLSEAARLMREKHVGSLVVVEEGAHGHAPVGVLTDRDITVAVVAKDLDARTISVGEAMSGDLLTVREDDSVIEALRLMRERGVRRVPVTQRDGTLVGIVTLDDLLEVVADQLRELVRAIASERSHEARARG